MPDLRAALSQLAENIATEVLAAIRSASLDDLVADVRGTPSAPSVPRVALPRGRPPIVRPNVPMPGATARTALALTPRAKSSGPFPRRTPEEVHKTVDRVVALVKTSAGLRSEEIRERVGLGKREMPRVLAMGLKTKKLNSKRVKPRATTHTAAA